MLDPDNNLKVLAPNPNLSPKPDPRPTQGDAFLLGINALNGAIEVHALTILATHPYACLPVRVRLVSEWAQGGKGGAGPETTSVKRAGPQPRAPHSLCRLAPLSTHA